MAKTKFRLPQDIDQYLAALSTLYAQEGKRSLQELVVNAKVRVHEEWESASDFGETWYGHALYLMLPQPLFLKTVKNKTKVQDQIQKDFNQLNNVKSESVCQGFLEMETQ